MTDPGWTAGASGRTDRLRSAFFGAVIPGMSKRPGTEKPQIGRPSVDSEAVNVRLLRDLVVRLDDWRREQRDLPGRAEAIRRLKELGQGPVIQREEFGRLTVSTQTIEAAGVGFIAQSGDGPGARLRKSGPRHT